MAKTILKLKRPISDIEVDMEEASLEAAGYVKVVRCEDCKHSVEHILGYGCGLNYHLATNGKWFCADGERRE